MRVLHFTNKQSGFTIVELLIVVVVIAILATITVVAYTGIQNRANDSAVQSDLSNIARKINMFYAVNGRYPQGSADMLSADIHVSKTAYSRGMLSGASWYNLVYCWPNTTNPDRFAVIAQSKSGNTFHYNVSGVSQVAYAFTVGSSSVCSAAGVNVSTSGRDWFYNADAWQSYAKS